MEQPWLGNSVVCGRAKISVLVSAQAQGGVKKPGEGLGCSTRLADQYLERRGLVGIGQAEAMLLQDEGKI